LGHKPRHGDGSGPVQPVSHHCDPGLWPDPLSFRPGRFQNGAAAWSFIPFAAGERTCLGRSFAQLVLGTVLDVMAGHDLRFIAGSMRPRTGITLRPAGPLHLELEQ
jgi:cytochrome P450